MKNDLLGYCGLYCGGCSVYQNTVNGAPMKNENGEIMECKGCNSELTTGWCSVCDIKKCSRNKGIRYCLECSENPCERITEFMNESEYPYHLEIQDNMKLLAKIGFEEWIHFNENKYTCSNCKTAVNWFEKECSNCKQDLKRSYFNR